MANRTSCARIDMLVIRGGIDQVEQTVSRHIPRHARWTSHGPSEWRSSDGMIVRFAKRAWWADLSYRLRSTASVDGLSSWEKFQERLGPFKRWRNAMVEAERYIISLKNRHGDQLILGDDHPTEPSR